MCFNAMGRLNFRDKTIFLRKKHFCRLGNDLMNWLNTRERKWGSHKYCFWPVCSYCKQEWHAGCPAAESWVSGTMAVFTSPDTVQAGTAVCPLCGKGERRDHTGWPWALKGKGDRASWPQAVPTPGGARRGKIGLARRWKFASQSGTSVFICE